MARVFHICQEVGGRMIPVNGECDNFNYQSGCLGHEVGNLTSLVNFFVKNNSDFIDKMKQIRATIGAVNFTENQQIKHGNSDNRQHIDATNCTLDNAGNCRIPCPYWDIENDNCHCYPPGCGPY